MTSVGFRKHVDGPILVGTVGFTFPEIDRLTWEEFGTSGDTHYAFVVWGRVGAINTTSTVTDAQIEVGLGIPGTAQPAPGYICRPMDVADLRYRGGYRGTEFAFIATASADNLDFPLSGAPRTAWVEGEDLAVYAHIANNSDPGSIAVTFEIADLNYLVLNLDKLDAAGIDWDYVQTAAGTALNQTEQFVLWDAGFFPATSRNLTFAQVHYQAQNASGGPKFRGGLDASGAPTLGTFSTPAGLGTHQWGQPARTTAAAPFNATDHFEMLVGPVSNTLLTAGAGGISGVDQAAAPQTNLISARLFRFEAWKLAYYREVVHAEYPPPTLVSQGVLQAGLTQESGASDRFFPWEVAIENAAPADYTVLYQGVVDHQTPGLATYFSPRITTDAGRYLESPWVYVMADNPLQGVPVHEMLTELISGATGGPAEVRYQAYWDDRPGPLWSTHWPVRDVLAVGFFLDDDPDNVVGPPPTLPAVVQLVPGKEALGLGSLQALPIRPNAQEQIILEVPIEEFVSDTGYRRTWPRFSTVRKVYRWGWSGLSLAERDQLRTFFDANVTFKFTRDEEATAVAFALLKRPEYVDVGLLHSVSAEVGELVNIGP